MANNGKSSKKVTGAARKHVDGFKEFIAKGNVIDLAVGVIIGGAFGNIVSSIVNDILMPLLGIVIGGIDFTSLKFTIGDAVISYGNFIQNVVNFLIIALCVYIMINAINKVTSKVKKEEEKKEEAKKADEVVLLEEIRDLLKKNK